MKRTSIRLSLTVIGATAALAFAASAYAADGAKEAATAAQHAGFAAKSANIKQVHMHLHHTVNCLVGPKGDGFDAGQANPCAAEGNGAIPDTADAATKEKLMAALKIAKMGLASDDLATAQKEASETQMALKKIM